MILVHGQAAPRNGRVPRAEPSEKLPLFTSLYVRVFVTLKQPSSRPETSPASPSTAPADVRTPFVTSSSVELVVALAPIASRLLATQPLAARRIFPSCS